MKQVPKSRIINSVSKSSNGRQQPNRCGDQFMIIKMWARFFVNQFTLIYSRTNGPSHRKWPKMDSLCK